MNTVGLITILTLFALPRIAGAQDLFDVHNAFWMNLHHYLHALARSNEPLVEDLPAGATANERAQWTAAVDFYRSRFGKRSLLFDNGLLTIKQEFIALGSGDSLADAKLTPEHRQVLERVAPVYRQHRWPEHERRNSTYIATLQGLLRSHGQPIASRLASSYNDSWPTPGIRVDVVRDAGPPGNAYTTNVPRPTHITIGAEDQGLRSLELIFHEASHHWDQGLMRATADAAKAFGLTTPPDLWHAILFYNAGRIVADRLAAAGVRDYTLMMVDGKIFDRPGWHDALARHWPMFLDGDISREEAILRIVRDVGR